MLSTRTPAEIKTRLFRPAYLSTLCLGVFLVVFTFSITPIFETNDDTGYMLLLSGKVFSTIPEPQIYFQNIILTSILAGLYSFAPDVQWYGYFQVFVLFTALWCFCFSALSRKNNLATLLILLLFLSNLFLANLVFLQFTRTAYISAQSGILLALTLFSGSSSNTFRKWALLLVALLLLLISFSLRIESFLLAILLNSPLFLFIKPAKENVSSLKNFLIVFVLLSACLWWGHHHHYADESWERFTALNEAKSTFNEDAWSQGATKRALLEEIGWSENDYHMLWNWGYVNERIFSPEKVVRFAGANQNQRMNISFIESKLNLFNNYVLKQDTSYIFVFLTLAAIMLTGRRNWKPTMALLITAVVVLFGILLWMKLPARIYFPAFTGVTIAALFASSCEPVFHNKRDNLIITGLMAILLISAPFWNQNTKMYFELSQNAPTANRAFRLNLMKMAPSHDQIYTVWGGGFPFEYILPLESKSYLDRFTFFGIGGFNQSPVQKKRIREIGLRNPAFAQDPFLGLVDHENHYIALKPWTKPILQKYLMEHYGMNCKLIPYYISNYFQFYRVVSN